MLSLEPQNRLGFWVLAVQQCRQDSGRLGCVFKNGTLSATGFNGKPRGHQQACFCCPIRSLGQPIVTIHLACCSERRTIFQGTRALHFHGNGNGGVVHSFDLVRSRWLVQPPPSEEVLLVVPSRHETASAHIAQTRNGLANYLRWWLSPPKNEALRPLCF